MAVAEKDFAISVAPASVPAGSIRFTIHNEGPGEHEFVVLKTDIDDGKLPVDQAQGEAEETGAGVTHVKEKEGIKSGATVELTTKLSPGRYVLICNLPSHYGLGMHATLTVQ